MEKILAGKAVASHIRDRVSQQIADLDFQPTMLLIRIGSDPASAYYVQNIIKSGQKLGCKIILHELDELAKQADLMKLIHAANIDPNIHGIMLQKPLPSAYDSTEVDLAINPDKDIDAIHPLNLGKIMNETDVLVPCTAAAVMETLKYYDIDPEGKNVVILGRSTVLGKPLANLLLQKQAFANATVTICHSKSQNLSEITRRADILIAAIGRAEYVKAEMIKENSILIDVGINLLSDAQDKAHYVGDIDYKMCFDKALAITPVPGGIGTITTSILFSNLLRATLLQTKPNKSIDDFS